MATNHELSKSRRHSDHSRRTAVVADNLPRPPPETFPEPTRSPLSLPAYKGSPPSYSDAIRPSTSEEAGCGLAPEAKDASLPSAEMDAQSRTEEASTKPPISGMPIMVNIPGMAASLTPAEGNLNDNVSLSKFPPFAGQTQDTGADANGTEPQAPTGGMAAPSGAQETGNPKNVTEAIRDYLQTQLLSWIGSAGENRAPARGGTRRLPGMEMSTLGSDRGATVAPDGAEAASNGGFPIFPFPTTLSATERKDMLRHQLELSFERSSKQDMHKEPQTVNDEQPIGKDNATQLQHEERLYQLRVALRSMKLQEKQDYIRAQLQHIRATYGDPDEQRVEEGEAIIDINVKENRNGNAEDEDQGERNLWIRIKAELDKPRTAWLFLLVDLLTTFGVYLNDDGRTAVFVTDYESPEEEVCEYTGAQLLCTAAFLRTAIAIASQLLLYVKHHHEFQAVEDFNISTPEKATYTVLADLWEAYGDCGLSDYLMECLCQYGDEEMSLMGSIWAKVLMYYKSALGSLPFTLYTFLPAMAAAQGVCSLAGSGVVIAFFVVVLSLVDCCAVPCANRFDRSSAETWRLLVVRAIMDDEDLQVADAYRRRASKCSMITFDAALNGLFVIWGNSYQSGAIVLFYALHPIGQIYRSLQDYFNNSFELDEEDLKRLPVE